MRIFEQIFGKFVENRYRTNFSQNFLNFRWPMFLKKLPVKFILGKVLKKFWRKFKEILMKFYKFILFCQNCFLMTFLPKTDVGKFFFCKNGFWEFFLPKMDFGIFVCPKMAFGNFFLPKVTNNCYNKYMKLILLRKL